MNNSVNSKYKLTVACKNYKESIGELNEVYDSMNNEYRPLLQ